MEKKRKMTLRLSEEGLNALDRLCAFKGTIISYQKIVSFLLLGGDILDMREGLSRIRKPIITSQKRISKAKRETISIDLPPEAFEKIKAVKRALYHLDNTGKLGKLSNNKAIEKFILLADNYTSSGEGGYRYVQAVIDFSEPSVQGLSFEPIAQRLSFEIETMDD